MKYRKIFFSTCSWFWIVAPWVDYRTCSVNIIMSLFTIEDMAKFCRI